MEFEITYDIELEPEEDHPSEHFADQENINEILHQLDCGNEWAWCMVRVRAKLTTLDPNHSFSGVSSWLGACSYQDEQDFVRDGYYSDLKEEALNHLIKSLHQAVKSGDLAQQLLNSMKEQGWDTAA